MIVVLIFLVCLCRLLPYVTNITLIGYLPWLTGTGDFLSGVTCSNCLPVLPYPDVLPCYIFLTPCTNYGAKD